MTLKVAIPNKGQLGDPARQMLRGPAICGRPVPANCSYTTRTTTSISSSCGPRTSPRMWVRNP